MSFIHLNGALVPEGEARISVQDRAILFGDGAYETMRSYAGRFFRFPEHLRRLRHTLSGMRLTLEMSDAAITEAAMRLVEANRIPDARLRLTVTGGIFGGEIRLRRTHPPNVIMTAVPLVSPPADAYRDGVKVVSHPWPVHSKAPLPHLKTVNRLPHLMAKEEALQHGAWEALFLDETGAILEGTATNVFFVVDGTLLTPSLSGPLLAGVTRDVVLEAARNLEISSREARVDSATTAHASEAFLTSTTLELLPIRELDGRKIGSGTPGPVWARLDRRYKEMVSRETS
ncbi:MAG TPA: aminotransferase class IV [Candidatus Eisenbacteria bacterium]|nr:aminotransferase class IV [Candidatus Eisenbacteria bacterium]